MDAVVDVRLISIHAPHTGRDSRRIHCILPSLKFQSTRPIRGATLCRQIGNAPEGISIHAPHTGRDSPAQAGRADARHFNPRAPYGARRPSAFSFRSPGYFNPRAPYGARPACSRTPDTPPANFNPRAPYGARRRPKIPIAPPISNFNPRAPYGARPRLEPETVKCRSISIHAPHTGRD